MIYKPPLVCCWGWGQPQISQRLMMLHAACGLYALFDFSCWATSLSRFLLHWSHCLPWVAKTWALNVTPKVFIQFKIFSDSSWSLKAGELDRSVLPVPNFPPTGRFFFLFSHDQFLCLVLCEIAGCRPLSMSCDEIMFTWWWQKSLKPLTCILENVWLPKTWSGKYDSYVRKIQSEKCD